MIFKLNRQEDGSIIQYSPVIPSVMASFTIPDARGLYATGNFGASIFYQLDCPDFSIGYYQYIMKNTTVMYSIVDTPVVELHFTLHNNAWYNLQGIGEV